MTDTTEYNPEQEKILWSSVSRNQVILAEAGDDPFGGAVSATARELLAKKSTAGYEYHTQKRSRLPTQEAKNAPRLKGIKFHIHDHSDGVPRVWVFAAVYNPKLVDKIQVQSFLEKIVGISQLYREDDPDWKFGSTLAAQNSFAAILQQRMREVTYLGKVSMLHEKLDESKKIMEDNITRILEQEDKLDELRDETTQMQEMASVFKKRARKVRRMKMMQNAKHGLVLGTAVTAGVAIVVVPPLVALL